tara:strand:+ start:63234 stop:64439 length:1206 start_codon:yes stop_codon:yes gene_type:complete
MKIGIIREGKVPADKRVVLPPALCVKFKKQYPEIELVVQPSAIRAFPDSDYIAAGIDMNEDLSDCDVLLGVKEVPLDMLIPNKTYFFFSHTYKKQEYNKDLLNKILADKIEFIDYELLKYATGVRLLGFGRFAGIVGAYNGFRLLGERTKTFSLKAAYDCHDLVELKQELKKVILPKGYKIVMTGDGRVGHGSMEILDCVDIKKMNPDEYISYSGDEAVYTQLGVTDYNRKKDGTPSTKKEFYTTPELFESDFMRFAKTSDMYVASHYWSDKSPFIFTREDAKHPDFRIKTVSDISCDIDCAVASTLRPSTIADPFYAYLASEEKEVSIDNMDAIAVMAVDNLPCELPRDASEGFGAEFMEKVLPVFFGADPEKIIYRATETKKDGTLNEPFRYLEEWRNS